MLCPRCATALVPQRLKEHSLVYDAHGCERCGGLLIGPETLREVELETKAALVEFKLLPSAVGQRAPLSCPRCTEPMEKVTSFRDRDVMMDLCPQCQHTWLDKGELAAIRVDGLGATLRQLLQWKKRG